MKKLTILFFALFLGIACFAQKESGNIYSEHELIDKTKALWSQLKNGDKDTFVSYFADSLLLYQNGKPFKIAKERMGRTFDYWSGFENLEISNDHKSSPDALQYGEYMFVQDWLKFSGVHKETGIISDMNMHNLYGFDANGKIQVMYRYNDPKLYEEITNSSKTIENGTVFINHPYINTVRKLLNDYIAKDVEAWSEYFVPNAVFMLNSKTFDDYLTLKERKESLTEVFADRDKVIFEQIGYPDCIYYAIDDFYHVLSWWTVTDISKEGEKYVFPIALIHRFNKDGKIVWETAYFNAKK